MVGVVNIAVLILVPIADLEFSRLEFWSRDSFLQVLVLKPSSLGLGLGTSESWSWSWNPRVSVSVLVLEPQSLGRGLGLGLESLESRSWDNDAFKQLHPLLKSLLSACHLCSCGTDI